MKTRTKNRRLGGLSKSQTDLKPNQERETDMHYTDDLSDDELERIYRIKNAVAAATGVPIEDIADAIKRMYADEAIEAEKREEERIAAMSREERRIHDRSELLSEARAYAYRAAGALEHVE